MSKRGENIYKRKDGRWEGRYIKCRTLHGRIQYGYVYGKSYSAVKSKLKETASMPIQTSDSRGTQPTSYSEILKMWLLSAKNHVKESTFSRYNHLVERHIQPFLGGYQIGEISNALLEKYIDHLLQCGRLDGSGGLSPKSVSDILVVIKRSMRYAQENNHLVICSTAGLSVKRSITGFTQCGKSTTMQHIISEIVNEDVSFIVIESAKKQYCELLGDSRLSGKMKVYSGGYDTTLLQINPFQPETGTILDNHIQSLVALFVSLFDEPAPLPQIINLLVHKVYTSTGWNSKDRIKPNEEREYPTINTMIQLIDEVIDEIRYSSKYPETAENMRGVIRGRLLSIIQGAMNDVLNTTNNISIEEMFSTSAVVELDDFAETNKTFMSGLLALKTYEYSRNSDYGSKTKRLLIIEEAHNIVPNTEQKRVSSNIAMCSNHFTSMLAEVAAYGTGLVIIDQRPTAVSPAVVANTGTKIIHNLQAGEDKTAVGASLGLTETEVNMISDLKVGQAIVKIPNSSEKCRVNINRNLIEANVVNWGVLFLGSNQQRYISPGVAPSERSYFLSCGSSAEAIINCLSFAELRLHRLMDFPEKMLYAGELLNTIKTSVRNKRQILYEVFEVVR